VTKLTGQPARDWNALEKCPFGGDYRHPDRIKKMEKEEGVQL